MRIMFSIFMLEGLQFEKILMFKEFWFEKYGIYLFVGILESFSVGKVYFHTLMLTYLK